MNTADMPVTLPQYASMMLHSALQQFFILDSPRRLPNPAWKESTRAITPQEVLGPANAHLLPGAHRRHRSGSGNPLMSAASSLSQFGSVSADRTRRGGGTSTGGGCRGTPKPSAATTPPLGALATTRRARTTWRRPTLTTRRSLCAGTSPSGSSCCAPSALTASALTSSRATVRPARPHDAA